MAVYGKKIGVVSLGCDKNRVDTEKMLAILKTRHSLVEDPEQAQIIIINTCAFLKAAREEAIEEILSAARFKEKNLEKLVVTGCLPQKYIDGLFGELTEADAFLGVSDYGEILSVIDRMYSGERVNAVGAPRGECGKERVLSTDGYAYLKIADGCSNRCTYCLIPGIRGKYRSVPVNDLAEEAGKLGVVEELILVAQDVAAYGKDLTPASSLAELIRVLSALGNVRGIRLLYCYPENITDELIRELQTNAKLIRYIDIPFQHADDRILKLMNRKGTGASYLALIEKLKREVPGIAVRSTFIAGFPTESEEDFARLTAFLKEAELFNAGFFAYSREEDTPADRLSGHLPEAVKKKRVKKLYAEQKKVIGKIYRGLKGKSFSVYVEGFDGENCLYCGRAYFNAPDVDGKIYFFSDVPLVRGDRINVKIIGADGYDLYGEKI